MTAGAFGQSTPDPEPFVVGDGILETVESYQAVTAEGFGFPGGVPPVGKEKILVGSPAGGLVSPFGGEKVVGEVNGVVDGDRFD